MPLYVGLLLVGEPELGLELHIASLKAACVIKGNAMISPENVAVLENVDGFWRPGISIQILVAARVRFGVRQCVSKCVMRACLRYAFVRACLRACVLAYRVGSDSQNCESP